MTLNSKTYTGLRSITGIFLVLIMLFAGSNSAVQDQGGFPLNQEDKDQKENPEEEFKIIAYEAVLPLIQANFSIVHYFFFSVEPIVTDYMEEEGEYLLPFISYFNTLFRLIISPNAP